MTKKLVSWDDVALALPAVVWTKLLATFDALGAAAAVTPASIGAATPASVTAAVTALVNAAPGTMDTLGEIATIIASDESAAAALLTSVAAKATTVALTAETSRATTAEGLAAAKASNLSDLASAVTARTNLGLGTAATHATGDYDAAGAATTAQTAAASDATSKVATETTRATTAETAAVTTAGTNADTKITANNVTERAAQLATYALPLTATTVKTTGYTATANQLVPVDATSAPVTVTLPTAPADKTRVTVKKIDATANLVTIASAGSDVFNVAGGTTTKTLTLSNQAGTYQYATTGAIWYLISDDIPLSGLDGRYGQLAATVIRTWNARRQAAFERDNAQPGTVFIDSINGSDANSGATPALAYQTIGKLTTAGVVAGSRIMLRRGSSFTIGAFTFPTLTGTPSATNRTVFGSYGSGPLPIITGNIFQITAAGIGGSFIDIQDVKFTANGGGYALFIFNATTQTDCRVKRCEFGPHTGTGGIIMGVIGGLVEDCNFHDIWSNVEYPSGGGNGAFMTTGSDSTEVRYNTVTNCYKGLLVGNTHRDVVFHHNVLIKCRVNGLDMGGGGVSGHPPRIYNNFVWHNPTTPNGHGIDTQGSTCGPVWRNNIVYCDYTAADASNVEMYCIDSATYPSVDVDYNLGWQTPGCTAPWGKLITTTYATLALFQTALNGTSYAGKEAHSISADPLLANVAGSLYFPLPGSPASNAGVVIGGVNDQYLGAAPDLGAYEVS